ncbi:MAG TPA: OmpA family protein [Candidatus Acidoferrum sp.]|jgi:chemotaxis protein MotB|nr:OmpA family protein [Candidatus Acidoferrum sp.]
MPKETWIIASILTVLLLVGLLGYSSYDKKRILDQAQAALVQARAAAAKTDTESANLKDKLAEAQDRIAELQKETAAVVQSHRSLEDEMRAALESKDVTISQLQGKLTVNILDRVLFDSGEAELKPGGEAVLLKVAAILAQHPNIKIHVIGHTDNVPIRASARSRFPSNWVLSTARATAAVRFLTEKAGVDPRRLGAVGYGEFRPVADNSTTEGRARNRRIAITILSEEMAGADVAAPAGTNSLPKAPTLTTNAPVQSVPSTTAPPPPE